MQSHDHEDAEGEDAKDIVDRTWQSA